MSRHGRDTALVDMALRRLQKESNDAEKVKWALQTLEKNGLALAEAIISPRTTSVLTKILGGMTTAETIVLGSNAFAAAIVANHEEGGVAEELYDRDIRDISVDWMTAYGTDASVQSALVNLLGCICDATNSVKGCNQEGVIRHFLDGGVLSAVATAMRQHVTEELLCEAGTYIIYWFECAKSEDIQRAVCGQPLNIALEAAIADFEASTGTRPCRRNDTQLLEILSNAALLEEMDKDPVMGALRRSYERHKDTNKVIGSKGLEVQFAVIERQRREAKLFTCMNCDKGLPKSERLICGGCRVAIYCSKDCQRKHWKSTHKADCKRQQGTQKS
mmetsp:Transcript_29972/g.49476  ORF Transcript_29972/g.49476 Transcript_29972/m.49476 type:complete len:332 (-) Transcript_29972:144-1139(-)|eukprot:CAMPEP_0119014154 /NCGR_PEP_ID=MMETSP1176-20130426/9382_1 /TAXON_ID=265551 /ORGANISM="Synedropsis recta cf, Strain CCMP1620" /LENGTH=331 /DNA_ID=CAMNT_0006967295 /DNA_START=27 /DNA_END=1022 /DNA_ORIENTATION=-